MTDKQLNNRIAKLQSIEAQMKEGLDLSREQIASLKKNHFLGTALRAALSGVTVNMSGQAVGEIVAGTVDEAIGRSAYAMRYSE